MRNIGWPLLLAALTLVPDEAGGQVVVGPSGPGIIRGDKVVIVRKRPGVRPRIAVGILSASTPGVRVRDPFAFPPVVSRVRIITILPPPPPPVIVLVPLPSLSTMPRSPADDSDVPPVPGPEEGELVPDVPRVPEKPRTPPPEIERRKPRPMPREAPKEAPKKEEPRKEAPKPPPRKTPELPRPPGPADDPREEYERLLERGQEAFKDLEYGRAAQRFRQAIRLMEKESLPRFLLAQALLAQGKYHEAYDAIVEGLRRKPDWPGAKFRPIELYGDAVGEYPEHLAALREALRRHPNDPVLLFLTAYQLWFDGRKEEARPLLRRALPRAADRDAIDRFLRALPPVEL
jgi:hypothetical protein